MKASVLARIIISAEIMGYLAPRGNIPIEHASPPATNRKRGKFKRRNKGARK